MSAGDVSTRARTDIWLPAALLMLAGLGWWWSTIGADAMGSRGMQMGALSFVSLAAFLVAWVAMMAAMMFPAILPVVRIYARAAAAGNAAPVAVFVGGYIALWSVVGIPAFFAWSALSGPLAHASPWVGRFAGAVALAAGVYQLTPLKTVCLRHCRTPLSFFLQHGKNLDRRVGAFIAGGRHGLFCLGCCWMLMVLLIAFGTMHLGWMLALTVVIVLEKVTSFGEQVARVTAAVLLFLGAVLLVHPAFIIHLV